jgi:hypothetical protein
MLQSINTTSVLKQILYSTLSTTDAQARHSGIQNALHHQQLLTHITDPPPALHPRKHPAAVQSNMPLRLAPVPHLSHLSHADHPHFASAHYSSQHFSKKQTGTDPRTRYVAPALDLTQVSAAHLLGRVVRSRIVGRVREHRQESGVW